MAKVTQINPTVDSNNGTVKVTLEFAGKDLNKMKEGAFARVRLVLDTHENALLLPKDVLLDENGRKFVFLAEASEAAKAENSAGAPDEIAPRLVARRVEVKTGIEDSASTEIFEGLAETDRVVCLGQQTLKNGAPIKVTNLENELKARAAAAVKAASDAVKKTQQ